MTDAPQDPVLLEVLNFIERCRSLEIITGGPDSVDRSAERLVLRNDADILYRKLEAIKWGVQNSKERCHAGKDGDCIHPNCPQTRDDEPAKSGRPCPLWWLEEDE